MAAYLGWFALYGLLMLILQPALAWDAYSDFHKVYILKTKLSAVRGAATRSYDHQILKFVCV